MIIEGSAEFYKCLSNIQENMSHDYKELLIEPAKTEVQILLLSFDIVDNIIPLLLFVYPKF